jgi:hypothetical protein
MTSYQTAKLVEYATGFQRVAREIADAVRLRIRENLKEYDGSYSVLPASSQETAAKIIIYEPHLGRENHPPFPLQHPGVYILIRHNGEIGPRIWQQIHFSPNLFERCSRNVDIGVAPKHEERFRFFPVMAGESLDRIADLLAGIGLV